MRTKCDLGRRALLSRPHRICRCLQRRTPYRSHRGRWPAAYRRRGGDSAISRLGRNMFFGRVYQPDPDVQACVDQLSHVLDILDTGIHGVPTLEPTGDGQARFRGLGADVNAPPFARGPAMADPPGPCQACVYYTGSLTGPGDLEVQPAGAVYYVPPGTHTAYLRGPVATNFDLFLMRLDVVTLTWLFAAYARTADSDEDLVHTGAGGFYAILVYSISGGGGLRLLARAAGHHQYGSRAVRDVQRRRRYRERRFRMWRDHGGSPGRDSR